MLRSAKITAAATLLGFGAAGTTADTIESTFDTDTEGWFVETRNSTYTRILDTFDAQFVPDADGGFIRATDPTGDWTVFRAPPAYEGDHSDTFTHALSFDYRTDTLTLPEGLLVVLFGGGEVISAPIPEPRIGQWLAVHLPFDDRATWLTGSTATGDPAADALIQTVLSDVTALLIGAETGAAQAEETVDLDNVIFGNPCVADCDASGTLDIFDFICYQDLFAGGDPAADVNDDGELNIFDFIAFQQAFQEGCQ